MAELQKGEVYTLKVIDLKVNHSNFQPTKSGADKIYCHALLLQDNTGEEYAGQICTVYKFYNECKIGDMVAVKIKQLSQSTYTFTELKNLTEVVVPKDDKPITSGGIGTRQVSNPHMAGTAAAIALQAAVQLVCGSDNPPGTTIDAQSVIAEADLLHEWLLLKAD